MKDKKLKYENITISGKIGVGSTTLSASLRETLQWKYINAGQLQREFDRQNNINEHLHGALSRTDEHEREMENMAVQTLQNEKYIIYEAWLSGFIARDMVHVLKVLLMCTNDAVRIDRVVNRENIDVITAKQYIKQREEENIKKWKNLYRDFDFWSPAYYDLVIDTYASGPMETAGKVLDKLGYHNGRKT